MFGLRAFPCRIGARSQQLIAHRGASGYAPEHTFASYQLALDQNADFVEPDLAVSKDGVLVCLHDDTLERSTNVKDIFPGRYSHGSTGRNGAKQWIANHFTVAEMKQLDAGSWRDAKFAGAKMPRWEENGGHGGIGALFTNNPDQFPRR
jgi:glycerophosphoryl diester phosphodiesterase